MKRAFSLVCYVYEADKNKSPTCLIRNIAKAKSALLDTKKRLCMKHRTKNINVLIDHIDEYLLKMRKATILLNYWLLVGCKKMKGSEVAKGHVYKMMHNSVKASGPSMEEDRINVMELIKHYVEDCNATNRYENNEEEEEKDIIA